MKNVLINTYKEKNCQLKVITLLKASLKKILPCNVSYAFMGQVNLVWDYLSTVLIIYVLSNTLAVSMFNDFQLAK